MPAKPKYPDYPPRDIRRLLRTLLAIDELGHERLVDICRETGYSHQNVADNIKRAQAQLGVTIDQSQGRVRLESWGPALSRAGVKRLLRASVLQDEE